MIELMGRFDVVYSSEPSYTEVFERYYPWADVVVLDADRKRFPISATMLPSIAFAQAYPHLPREYQILVNKKVLIAGPESGGKTQLAKKLALMLGTSCTVEMGRLFCERYGVPSPAAALYPDFVFAQKEAERHAARPRTWWPSATRTPSPPRSMLTNTRTSRLTSPTKRRERAPYDKVFFVEPTNPRVQEGLRDSGTPERR